MRISGFDLCLSQPPLVTSNDKHTTTNIVEVRGKRLGQNERLYEVVACMAVGNTVSSSGVNVLPLH